MQKFTIFSVLLTLVVAIVAVELFVTEYMPNYKKPIVADISDVNLPSNLDLSNVISTNVLGSDVQYDKIPEDQLAELKRRNIADIKSEEAVASQEVKRITDVDSSSSSGWTTSEVNDNSYTDSEYSGTDSRYSSAGDFEAPETNKLPVVTSAIRVEMLKSAGFAGAVLSHESFNGMLFRTANVSAILDDVDASKYAVKSSGTLVAKIYIFNMGINRSSTDVFNYLMKVSSKGSSVEVNKTDDFGDASFYMNDPTRNGVAFLAVKFGDVIYAFSYPKKYHQQIKNLLYLIDLEF